MRHALRWLALPSTVPLLASGQSTVGVVLAVGLGWSGVGGPGSDIRIPHIDSLVEQGSEPRRQRPFQ